MLKLKKIGKILKWIIIILLIVLVLGILVIFVTNKILLAKEKEMLEDGSVVTMGSRNFLKELSAKIYGEQQTNTVTTKVDMETGELIETPIENIIG